MLEPECEYQREAILNPLETKIKLNYRTEKLIKKINGKQTARELAFGKNILKMIKENYKDKSC